MQANMIASHRAAATLSEGTRSAFPRLSALVDYVVALRASGFAYAHLRTLPSDLRRYVDQVYGTAPRAADKRKGRAVALRELTALDASPDAARELTTAFLGT